MSELPVEQLAKVSKLFEVLDEAGRQKLMALSSRKSFPDGTVICREGEVGEEFYVVTKGQVRVTCDDFGVEKELATLGAGQFFGEMAVLSGHKRQATVTAQGIVDVVGFARASIDAVLAHYPAAREVLNRVGVMRTEDTMQKMMS